MLRQICFGTCQRKVARHSAHLNVGLGILLAPYLWPPTLKVFFFLQLSTISIVEMWRFLSVQLNGNLTDGTQFQLSESRWSTYVIDNQCLIKENKLAMSYKRSRGRYLCFVFTRGCQAAVFLLFLITTVFHKSFLETRFFSNRWNDSEV